MECPPPRCMHNSSDMYRFGYYTFLCTTAPPDPPENRSKRPLVHASMDNEPAHTTRAWTALRVRSFPTLETDAPPVDRQAAHRGLCPTRLKEFK